ncbi:hypothetical protein R5W23_000097 [Gemmata sp. JC673]|uniref:Carboxypeptidase regulatory-like domain-containing protein n=1 Tax=Gemmata algarum TaxID=2975278 RepID=A0ABU5EQX7_9BACT|nr:hypothetical protein [Gemmata algarum]MDY3557570.1 hypothetical protein [Gemmata algarum]
MLAIVACLAGCGGPSVVKVSGRVTLDGKGVEDGEIVLVPTDPKLGPDAGKITGGRFELMAKPGAKKVEIRANREITGKKDGAMGSPFKTFESIIPDRYNDRSELTLDVPTTDVTEKLFELKSEKRGSKAP